MAADTVGGALALAGWLASLTFANVTEQTVWPRMLNKSLARDFIVAHRFLTYRTRYPVQRRALSLWRKPASCEPVPQRTLPCTSPVLSPESSHFPQLPCKFPFTGSESTVVFPLSCHCIASQSTPSQPCNHQQGPLPLHRSPNQLTQPSCRANSPTHLLSVPVQLNQSFYPPDELGDGRMIGSRRYSKRTNNEIALPVISSFSVSHACYQPKKEHGYSSGPPAVSQAGICTSGRPLSLPPFKVSMRSCRLERGNVAQVTKRGVFCTLSDVTLSDSFNVAAGFFLEQAPLHMWIGR